MYYTVNETMYYKLYSQIITNMINYYVKTVNFIIVKFLTSTIIHNCLGGAKNFGAQLGNRDSIYRNLAVSVAGGMVIDCPLYLLINNN